MGEIARLSVTGVRRPRRRWTLAEKLAIVEAAKTSGDPVSVVARRHGMNANHLFNWLQRDREGTLDRGALDAESLGDVSGGRVCLDRDGLGISGISAGWLSPWSSRNAGRA